MQKEEMLQRFEVAKNVAGSGSNGMLREEIARQTEEFLKAGGRINNIDEGVTSEDKAAPPLGFHLKLNGSTPHAMS
jgi:hypothetical protein